jgi:hypothetical protein
MMPLIPGAVYRHVKTGTLYRLIAVGKHVETLEDLVVYEALYENTVAKIWVRPRGEFLGEAQSPDGSFHPRFTLEEEV